MSDTRKRRGLDAGRDANANARKDEPKKPKLEQSSNGDKSATNGAGKSVPAKPAVSLDVLEKAKKALQLQKQLQEKLKKLPVRACMPVLTIQSRTTCTDAAQADDRV